MTPIEMARNEAVALWQCSDDGLLAQDITEALPWLRHHTLVHVTDMDRSLTVALPASLGPALVFTGSSDLAPLNRLFEVESIRFPDGLPAEYFADAIRTLLVGPGGFVGSPKFLAEERDDVALWLRPPEDESMRLFEAHCAGPEVHTDGESWTLEFPYFNRRGAVEAWTVRGDAATIHEASLTLALPEWTFKFPYV